MRFLTAVNFIPLTTLIFGTSMNKRVNLNWKYTASIALCLCSTLMTTESFAKNLYKSVSAGGKITYSNHPPAKSQAAQNITFLKGSPAFSISKQAYRASTKS